MMPILYVKCKVGNVVQFAYRQSESTADRSNTAGARNWSITPGPHTTCQFRMWFSRRILFMQLNRFLLNTLGQRIPVK